VVPLLRFAWDGKVHSKREAVESIAKKLKRSDEGLKELLPSEERPLFDNRVARARTYSLQAGRK
jgi:restriction system protein